jgi:hypothetical protein
MAVVHTGIRAYAFDCTFNSSGWVDDPATLISRLQSALSDITNFSYDQLKIANVKNASGKKLEVEVMGIVYNTKKRLTASETDDLIDDLNTALLTVQDFVFLKIDICGDVFRDSPSTNWPGTWKRG